MNWLLWWQSIRLEVRRWYEEVKGEQFEEAWNDRQGLFFLGQVILRPKQHQDEKEDKKKWSGIRIQCNHVFAVWARKYDDVPSFLPLLTQEKQVPSAPSSFPSQQWKKLCFLNKTHSSLSLHQLVAILHLFTLSHYKNQFLLVSFNVENTPFV